MPGHAVYSQRGAPIRIPLSRFELRLNIRASYAGYDHLNLYIIIIDAVRLRHESWSEGKRFRQHVCRLEVGCEAEGEAGFAGEVFDGGDVGEEGDFFADAAVDEAGR